MAVFHQVQMYGAKLDQCEVIQYLLNGAWDIENSNRAQTFLWGAGRATARNYAKQLKARSVISRRVLELGQSFDGDFYNGRYFIPKLLDRLGLETSCNYYLRIIISYGADWTAMDYSEMGPLHLMLERYDDQWVMDYPKELWSHVHMGKLVFLFRAGCPVIDHRGEAPGDYARSSTRLSEDPS